MNVRDAKDLRKAPLETPTDLGSNAVRDISGALNVLLADMFGLYLKTKNFHAGCCDFVFCCIKHASKCVLAG